MSENINKIWGERRRMHLDDKTETDLLYVKKDTFCSTHTHKFKYNKFVVIKGKIRIETEFGFVMLEPNCIWTIYPQLQHRFYALEDSTMIEFGFVKKGKIDPDDINRKSQGGRIVEGKEFTLDEMREKGILEL